MKKFILAAAASIALTAAAVSACGSIEPGGSVTGQTLMDERAMGSLELAYNAAGNAYLTAVSTGVLTGERQERARIQLQIAYGALRAARAAYEVGDSSAFTIQGNALRAAVQQAERLTPKN